VGWFDEEKMGNIQKKTVGVPSPQTKAHGGVESYHTSGKSGTRSSDTLGKETKTRKASSGPTKGAKQNSGVREGQRLPRRN